MSGDSSSIGTVIAAGMTGVELKTDAKLDPQFLTGAAEMAQWLRVHTALTEGLSLVLCTHVGCSQPPETEA